jgi:nucleoside-diphosphate-sugar epimerase
VGFGPRPVEDVVAQMPAPLASLADDLDGIVERMRPLWSELRGARLFITGGTGFFGCWLLETLLHANDRLGLGVSAVVLTRDARAFARRLPHLATHAAVASHQGDVCSFAFPAGEFSHVIHAAVDAMPPATPADRTRVFDVIVTGTRRALDFARHSGARRFLLTSSGAVYGPQPSSLACIPEEHAGAPDPSNRATAGAEAKRAAETLCALYADETLQPTIARCFAFLGPYLPLDAKFAAGNFLRDAMAGGPIVVSGDGGPVRSYMYAGDLAVWLWTILLRGEAMRPYNVGSETAITIADLAHAIASHFTPSPEVRIARAATTGGAGSRYVPCTARARAELGLATTVTLDEAIARTVEWHAAG